MNRRPHTLVSVTLAGFVLSWSVALPASAQAAPWEAFEFAYGPDLHEDFCDVAGLGVIEQGVAVGRFRSQVLGDGFPHGYDHSSFVDTWTNADSGRFVTVEGSYRSGDVDIVDNGDGTYVIVVQNTGHATFYDMDGRVLARDAGIAVASLLASDAGTPGDFDDDELLAFLGVDRSVGAPTDFCDTVVAGVS